MQFPGVPSSNDSPVYLSGNALVYLNWGYEVPLPFSGVQGTQVQGRPVADGYPPPVPEPEPGTMCLVMGHGNHLHKGQSWEEWNALYFDRLRLFFNQDLRYRRWVKKIVILVDNDIPGLQCQWWTHWLLKSIRAGSESPEMSILECLQVNVRAQCQWIWTNSYISEKIFTAYINRVENGLPTAVFTVQYSGPVDCLQEVTTISTTAILDSLVLQNPACPVAFFNDYNHFATHVIKILEKNRNLSRLEFTLDLAPSFCDILQASGLLDKLRSLAIRMEYPTTAQSAGSLRNQNSALPSLLLERISSLQALERLEIPSSLASQGLHQVIERMISLAVLIVDGRPVDFRAALSPTGDHLQSSSIMNL